MDQIIPPDYATLANNFRSFLSRALDNPIPDDEKIKIAEQIKELDSINLADYIKIDQSLNTIEAMKNLVKKYEILHHPACYMMQNWDEAIDAISSTPECLKDEGWQSAYDEIFRKKNTCSCGLNDCVKIIEKSELALMQSYFSRIYWADKMREIINSLRSKMPPMVSESGGTFDWASLFYRHLNELEGYHISMSMSIEKKDVKAEQATTENISKAE